MHKFVLLYSLVKKWNIFLFSFGKIAINCAKRDRVGRFDTGFQDITSSNFLKFSQ